MVVRGSWRFEDHGGLGIMAVWGDGGLRIMVV